MRKFIILSIVILSLVACSSHEDELLTTKEPIVKEPENLEEPETSEAPEIVEVPETSALPKTPILAEIEIKEETEIKNILIGPWILNSFLENKVDKVTPCTKKSYLSFYSDGTFSDTTFLEVDGVCTNFYNDYRYRWKYLGDNNLILHFGDKKNLSFKLMGIKINNIESDYFLKQTAEDGKPTKTIRIFN